jgi:hypothetical protein
VSWLERFGRFWYDFLVGDRWELFVGPIVVLAFVAGLVATGVPGGVSGLGLFLGVVAVAGLSVRHAARDSQRR